MPTAITGTTFSGREKPMIPQDWNTALKPDVPTLEANKFIATIVRAHLEHSILADDLIGTASLVEMLYPAKCVTSDEHKAARDRIFKALTSRALGKHELKDCMTQGPVQKLGSSHFRGRPCLWHAPRKVARCETCGQPLIA